MAGEGFATGIDVVGHGQDEDDGKSWRLDAVP